MFGMASYLVAELSVQLAKLLHQDVIRIRKTAGSPKTLGWTVR
jgi:hypothetical protein